MAKGINKMDDAEIRELLFHLPGYHHAMLDEALAPPFGEVVIVVLPDPSDSRALYDRLALRLAAAEDLLFEKLFIEVTECHEEAKAWERSAGIMGRKARFFTLQPYVAKHVFSTQITNRHIH